MPQSLIYMVYSILVLYVIFRLMKPAPSNNTIHILAPLFASFILVMGLLRDTTGIALMLLNLILFIIFSVLKSSRKSNEFK